MLKELNSVRPLKRKTSLEESVDHSTEETSDNDVDFESSTTADHQTVDQSSSLPKPNVTREIIDFLGIPHAQKSKSFINLIGYMVLILVVRLPFR